MSFAGTRSEAEQALARALSRQIGYTSGAYDLARIFSVLGIFRDNPSVYKEELIAYLRTSDSNDSSESLTDQYLSEITNFAQSMRLIESVSSREAKLQRFAPTESGRSLLGVKAIGNEGFFIYYATKIVLIADADYLMPILLYHSQQQITDIQSYFIEFQTNLRHRRKDWLAQAFPERILYDRVARQISWMKQTKSVASELQIDIPTKNTARHHATPRQGWLQYLGLWDRTTKEITEFGRAVLVALEPSPPFFWLGPDYGVEKVLQIKDADGIGGPFEDALNFTATSTPATDEQIDLLISDLVDVMITGFPRAKLVHASQASLKLPIEYINYRSFLDGCYYRWEVVLERLFLAKKAVLQRFSAHRGQVGFYRLKAEKTDDRTQG